MVSVSASELEKTLGYHFKDEKLLAEALTHPSLGREKSYQRMEFLGDSVLGLAVAHLLFSLYPDEQEGSLAKRHAALICGSMLAEIARELKLGEYIRMSEGEAAAGGRDNASSLEDVCEAIIGAVYLEGGWNPVEDIVERLWKERAQSVSIPPRDAKTTLQEWAQGRGLPLPVYTVASSEGPAHSPVFMVEVMVEGVQTHSAHGRSKREAEQAAAIETLAYIETHDI